MDASSSQGDSYLLGDMRNQVQKAAELIAEHALLTVLLSLKYSNRIALALKDVISEIQLSLINK